ncbi:MAG: 5-formyltetrahydrofolate cyclo-ligase [Lentisphaerae bacterium]|nr:5-formyltetrahydrofolate cyclo-ligase [Lentisphaerota bacterium]
MNKDAIREAARRRRAALAPAARRERSARIAEAAGTLPEVAAARSVCAYLAVGAEVRTDALIAHCRNAGKTVCVPAYRADRGMYAPARLQGEAPRPTGPHGVPEPANPAWMPLDGIDVVFVPGVAFDDGGGRLGQGGGHYDRMLGEAAGAFKVGLAFECQMETRVPVGAGDVRMDVVVTESRIVRTRKERNNL